MSQYGAYGYALHGAGYPAILAHYYQGTALTTTNPKRIVKVLLQTGSASFSGASRAASKALKPGATYSVQPLVERLARARQSLGQARRDVRRAADRLRPGTADARRPGHVSRRAPVPARRRQQRRDDQRGRARRIRARRRRVGDALELGGRRRSTPRRSRRAPTRSTSDVGGSVYQLYSDTRSQAYGGVGAETAPRATPRWRPPAARSSPTTARRRSPTSSRAPAATPRASERVPGRGARAVAARRPRSLRRRRRQSLSPLELPDEHVRRGGEARRARQGHR